MTGFYEFTSKVLVTKFSASIFSQAPQLRVLAWPRFLALSGQIGRPLPWRHLRSMPDRAGMMRTRTVPVIQRRRTPAQISYSCTKVVQLKLNLGDVWGTLAVPKFKFPFLIVLFIGELSANSVLTLWLSFWGAPDPALSPGLTWNDVPEALGDLFHRQA